MTTIFERQTSRRILLAAVAVPNLQAMILLRRQVVGWYPLQLYRSIWRDLMDLRAHAEMRANLPHIEPSASHVALADVLYFHIGRRLRIAYSGGALVCDTGGLENRAYAMCLEALGRA